MTNYVKRDRLYVAEEIVTFAEESLDAVGLDRAEFWRGLTALIVELSPRNDALLAERDRLQSQLDAYHRAAPGQVDPVAYREFLTSIGYLTDVPDNGANITTANVDPEIATTAGPQLVVPLLNARFALNAANARWGSLYDALYGTDAVPQTGVLAPGSAYNPVRASEVITRGRRFLDDAAPLVGASHANSTAYRVTDGALLADVAGAATPLATPAQFVGYRGDPAEPNTVLLINNGLHIELTINRAGAVGKGDDAGIDDILLESAITTIMDLEDSVVAVDAEDKALGYRNWRDLMNGTLTAEVSKNGGTFTRAMNTDREYTRPDGSALTLPGRALLFVRNVGHLMRTEAVLDEQRQPVYEGVLDAAMTALGALLDLRRDASAATNSRCGSMYIVKPKMHGSAEVRFTGDLFAAVEDLLALPRFTLKLGLMDEERRTSANLTACIMAARDRVVFINTGFLDRTGDEIRTSMFAGPFPPKALMRERVWLESYERRNVAAGLRCGFNGRAQIGKGMWAMPDLMASMLEQKIEQVRSGASTAWVPSPTAATLHALHYHAVDVFAVRKSLELRDPTSLDRLLSIPLAHADLLDPDTVSRELDNNAQSILGYVVRWIDQGIGCSKVQDIHGVALMEDRATLRISSTLLANWLLHGVITEQQLDESLRRLSGVVDQQNADDPQYKRLLEGDDRLAYDAARRVIVEAIQQTNAYTEPVLHELRNAKKGLSR